MTAAEGVDPNERLKRAAAERAARHIEDGMVVGLGTGSTVRHLLEVIAKGRREGVWRRIVGVPTSRATEQRAQELGIPLTTLQFRPKVDLTLDGADEVDDRLRLIKGLGGALLREKIVAAASDRLVILVDQSKRVPRLGTHAPLPVEVDPFGAPALLPFLRDCGAEPVLRPASDGEPLRTDGGHWIIDCRFADGIDNPEALEARLQSRPGVLETGLFLGMTSSVVIASSTGIHELGTAPTS
jgi:ribose 5-phosphate isomerase A